MREYTNVVVDVGGNAFESVGQHGSISYLQYISESLISAIVYVNAIS